MDNNKIFDSLTLNALDFLDKAVVEIEDSPKYSVINLCAGVEIILKARLFLEHWTLVLDDPKNADLENFSQSAFVSISLPKAIERIKKVTTTVISPETQECFLKLANHRNKLLHFFHQEYLPKADKKVLNKIIIDTCEVWLHLKRLLLGQWQNEFREYEEQFSDLNSRMLRLQAYLKTIFETIKPEIDKETENGNPVFKCQICGYDASIIDNQTGDLIETRCLVCERNSKFLHVLCPECKSMISVFDMGEVFCEKCEFKADINYLLSIFGVKENPRESLAEPKHAYCPECECVEQPTVVPYRDKYLCLNCLAIFDTTTNCEWCGELNGGELEDSFLFGCAYCDGRVSVGD